MLSRITNAQIDAAYRRRDARLASEALATTVRYLPSRDAVLIEMNNGAALVIPRRLLQGLSDASPAQLRQACVAGKGTVVSWPELDADFTIMSLYAGFMAANVGCLNSPGMAVKASPPRRRGPRE